MGLWNKASKVHSCRRCQLGAAARGLPPETLEPVCYHEWPMSFWDSLMHITSATTVIDLTPATVRLALWHRVPYVAICHSQ